MFVRFFGVLCRHRPHDPQTGQRANYTRQDDSDSLTEGSCLAIGLVSQSLESYQLWGIRHEHCLVFGGSWDQSNIKQREIVGWTEFFRFLGYYVSWGGLKPNFGSTYPSHLRGSSYPSWSWTHWPLTMGSIGSPETSVSNHLTQRNNPKDGRIQNETALQSKTFHSQALCDVTLLDHVSVYVTVWLPAVTKTYTVD